MAITLPTAKHVQAQHAGVTAKSIQPTGSVSGHSIPVVSDVGELGGLLFGHTVSDNVVRSETVGSATQTSLGGFISKSKASLPRKATATHSTAVDPGAQNRTVQAATTQANQIRAAARRQANNLLAAARRQANKIRAGLPSVTSVLQPPQGTPPNG